MMHMIIRVLCVLGLTLFCVACGGGGGGGGAAPVSTTPPPPQPPPIASACTGADTFPGFLYTAEGTVHLSSNDGCHSELVSAEDIQGPMHMTADRSKGVIVWSERSDGNAQTSHDPATGFLCGWVRQLAESGQPVTILPLAGEEALPGDNLHYEVGDVWGDATHDSLYITVKRHGFIQLRPQRLGRALEWD